MFSALQPLLPAVLKIAALVFLVWVLLQGLKVWTRLSEVK